MSTLLTEINQSQSQLFAEKLINIMNDGALALMISIGHRTRLFDVMAQLPPSTSEQIATAARLNERYVREWLGAVVTGGIVEYDPADQTFTLPIEHAAFLTRAASPNNLAVGTQFLPLLGSVEDKIVECFHKGGGVPYSEFGRFHEIMAEESSQTVVACLLDSILPLVPGLTEALELGIDVVDVGCGSGQALILLARTFPNSRFTGLDLSSEAVSRAREEAAQSGLTNITFEARDVTNLELHHQFDLVTAFDAIHDQAKPALVLEGIFKALRPGGVFLMQDISGSSHVHEDTNHPLGTYLYTISCMHCMTVSLAQNGDGLGAMWGKETAVRMLGEAGFAQVDVESLPHDPINFFYVSRKN